MQAKQIDQFKQELKETFIKKEPPSEWVLGSWDQLLRRINYKDAVSAMQEMMADENKTIYTFPLPADIKPYLTSSKIRVQCPCCNNTGFVQWWLDEESTDVTDTYQCQCRSSKKRYERDGHDICNNIQCQNQGHQARVYVPPGWGYTQRSLLATCKYSPNITEHKTWAEKD